MRKYITLPCINELRCNHDVIHIYIQIIWLDGRTFFRGLPQDPRLDMFVLFDMKGCYLPYYDCMNSKILDICFLLHLLSSPYCRTISLGAFLQFRFKTKSVFLTGVSQDTNTTDSNGKLISLEMLLWQMIHFCIFTSRRAMINLTEGTPCGAITYAA